MARATATASPRDTIAAPATAPGAGAIAIVRVSGAGTAALVESVFSRHSELDPARMVLGHLRDAAGGETIDQCLAVRWVAPASYTGEDMAEFHLHGSPAIVDRAMRALIAAGARAAQPGEFTRRAFLNGKLDLAQAESVAALSASATDAARRVALHQLGGGLSRRLLATRARLVQATAELEAAVDYPEEELPPLAREMVAGALRDADRDLALVLDSMRRGRVIAGGARVVLAGPPNAGKSSLFNALVGRERAIVSPHPGTTRDTIEATIDLGGIPLTLIDTAGLRSAAEEIEAIGIAKTRDELAAADLVLYLIDAAEVSRYEEEEYRVSEFPHMPVVSKCDLAPFTHIQGALRVSAATREGIAELEAAIRAHFLGYDANNDEPVIASARHEAALSAARESLQSASAAHARNMSPEFVVLDLALALSEIDALLGKGSLDEDILDAVFSTFCIGK